MRRILWTELLFVHFKTHESCRHKLRTALCCSFTSQQRLKLPCPMPRECVVLTCEKNQAKTNCLKAGQSPCLKNVGLTVCPSILIFFFPNSPHITAQRVGSGEHSEHDDVVAQTRASGHSSTSLTMLTILPVTRCGAQLNPSSPLSNFRGHVPLGILTLIAPESTRKTEEGAIPTSI